MSQLAFDQESKKLSLELAQMQAKLVASEEEARKALVKHQAESVKNQGETEALYAAINTLTHDLKEEQAAKEGHQAAFLVLESEFKDAKQTRDDELRVK